MPRRSSTPTREPAGAVGVRSRYLALCSSAALFLVLLCTAQASRAEALQWQEGWNVPGLDGAVEHLASLNDTLYVAGRFSLAGAVLAPRLARWDGRSWSSAAWNADVPISMLGVWRDHLLAGGDDGRVLLHSSSGWQDLGLSPRGAPRFFCEYRGELLISRDPSPNGRRFMRFDGQTWSPLPDALGAGSISAFCTWGDRVVLASMSGWKGLMTWDGEDWSLFAPFEPSSALRWVSVVTLGDTLILAGEFDSIGGVSASNLALWDGNRWTTIANESTRAHAAALVGKDIYLALERDSKLEIDRLDGTTLTTVVDGEHGPARGRGAQPDYRLVLGAHEQSILVAGAFLPTAGCTAARLGIVDGDRIVPFAESSGNAVVGNVVAAAPTRHGLLVGGDFHRAGNVLVKNIALWNGDQWLTVGEGLPESVYWVGEVGDQPLACDGGFHRWDGRRWNLVGGNLSSQGRPFSFAVLDGTLWLSGSVQLDGESASIPLVRLNGDRFEKVDTGEYASIGRIQAIDGSLYAAAARDDLGTGTHIIRWNGTGWTPEGPEVPYREVFDFVRWDGRLVVSCLDPRLDPPALPAEAILVLGEAGWSELVPVEQVGSLDLETVGNDLIRDYSRGGKRWNGQSWEEWRGGFANSTSEHLPAGGYLTDVVEWSGAQFVIGQFAFAGGTPSAGFAQWGITNGAPVPLPDERHLLVQSNPFRRDATFLVVAPTASNARIEIFGPSGRRVRGWSERLRAGVGPLRWDGMDGSGSPVAQGSYWVRVSTPVWESAARVVKLR